MVWLGVVLCERGEFYLSNACQLLLSIRFIFESEVRFAKRYEIALVFLASAMGLAVNQAALSCRAPLMALLSSTIAASRIVCASASSA